MLFINLYHFALAVWVFGLIYAIPAIGDLIAIFTEDADHVYVTMTEDATFFTSFMGRMLLWIVPSCIAVLVACNKAIEKAEESDYNYNRQHTKKVTQIDLTTDYMLNTTGTAKKVEVQTSTQHASTGLQVVLCIFAIIIEPFYFAYLILEILSQ